MAEQLRRLDYERRSKYKCLMKAGSSLQTIKKECSTQVRAANEMEERKKQLYLLKNHIHKRTFIERHDYEVKVIERFKSDLDTKSQTFNEEKFQLLRAKSAGTRLNKNPPVVLAIVPKKYYENLTDDSEEEDNKSYPPRTRTDPNPPGGHDTDTRMLLNFSTLRAVLKFKSKKKPKAQRSIKRSTSFSDSKQDRIAESMRFLHPDEFRRFKEEAAGTPSQTSVTLSRPHTVPPTVERTCSAMIRRQSSVPNPFTAYIPRDVKSAPPGRRASYLGQGNDLNEENGSRSYRLLKDAFRKKRKEIPNPAKDRFKKIQTDHEKHVALLNERIKKRFNDIFEESVFEPCNTASSF